MALSKEILERRQAGRRAEIVEQILPIFGTLLREHTCYLEVPVEEIFRRAGVSRTTFYRHFEDKNHLLLALGADALRDIRAASMEVWRLPSDATRRDLVAGLRRSIVAYQPHLPVMDAMLEVACYDLEVRRHLQAAFDDLRDMVGGHLAGGQAAGFVRPSLHAQETAGWITWMAERGLRQLVAEAEPAQAERLIESLADIIWFTAFDGQGRVDDT